MPLYEYECSSCGKVSEVMQKFSDPPMTQCSHCKTGKVNRLMSRTSFQLKGSGWYASDYKKSTPPSSSSDTAPSTEAKKADCTTPGCEAPKGGGCKGGTDDAN